MKLYTLRENSIPIGKALQPSEIQSTMQILGHYTDQSQVKDNSEVMPTKR